MSDTFADREWHFYLDDILIFAERVLTFTDGVTAAQFLEDAMRRDATIRNLELIGEAATHIPPEVRQASAQIPWRMMIATRNQLIHAYLGIDNDILWSIIQTDIPALLTDLVAFKKTLSP